MRKEYVLAPGIHKAAHLAHAVRTGTIVYTSGITPRCEDGVVAGKGDLVAQTEQTFKNMDAVLRAAGATWNDVVKANFYWPTATYSREQWQAHREVRDRYLRANRYAAVGACMEFEDPDILFELECVAHIGGPKQAITGIPEVYIPPAWAQAVRAGDNLYLSGQHAIAPGDPGPSTEICDGIVRSKGDTTAQTRAVYRNHAAVLKAAGATWGDAFRVNQYVTRRDYREDMRAGRKDYFPRGRALSTSVRCKLAHPDCIIQVSADAYLGPRQTFTSPEVWVVPGTVQSVRTGSTVYLQGQIPVDTQGKVVGKGSIVAQAERMFRNAGAMLRAAGAKWEDVVHARGFYSRPEDICGVLPVQARYLADGHYAATSLSAQFFTPFTPDMLLEVEFIAVVD